MEPNRIANSASIVREERKKEYEIGSSSFRYICSIPLGAMRRFRLLQFPSYIRQQRYKYYLLCRSIATNYVMSILIVPNCLEKFFRCKVCLLLTIPYIMTSTKPLEGSLGLF